MLKAYKKRNNALVDYVVCQMTSAEEKKNCLAKQQYRGLI